ncbi:MAG: hypothetical protein A3F43_05900 [Gammaproteobacteria bacterium RIFCSPHIGHO2_12_FULL_42_10]|nr:MAG: hypothetical protein A3F43_05900 [Gammaproteobacteria bacterium RIFCSPHIGHO2_12_FULL_42_10]
MTDCLALDKEPIALIRGQAYTDLPADLYIPPDAMKVFLEAFEGPLDLLLYLIRKQNLDILDIPIAKVTEQYMEYVDYMKTLSLDLAAEYLVMAAILAEIKSRLLLPKKENPDTAEEADPRAALVRRLQEYERYKQVSLALDNMPRAERDFFTVNIDRNAIAIPVVLPNIALQDLVRALGEVLKRTEFSTNHHVILDALSVREKMTYILDSIQKTPYCPFNILFQLAEGRLGVVVTFLAMLELLKEGYIQFVQATAFGPIYLTPTQSSQAAC